MSSEFISYLSAWTWSAVSEEEIESAFQDAINLVDPNNELGLNQSAALRQLGAALEAKSQSGFSNALELAIQEGPEGKSLMLEALGLNADEFISEIEQGIGNTSSDFAGLNNSTSALNEIEAYNSNSIIQLLGENEDLVNDVIIMYLVNVGVGAGTSLTFTDFLETAEGKEEIKELLNRILARETGLFGLTGVGSANTGGNTAAEIVNRLNEAAGNSAVPEDPEDTEADADQISDAVTKQCVLLQLLEPLSSFYDDSLKEIINKDIPYSGRILKLNCNEPSNFINYVSAVPGLEESFTKIRKPNSDDTLGVITPLNDFRLSFIKDHQGQLVELPIYYNGEFNHSVLGGDPPTTDEAIAESIDTDDDSAGAGGLGDLKGASPDPSEGPIELKPIGADFIGRHLADAAIDVIYEGTNPATYRNDVQVTVSFTSDKLNTFTKNWTYNGLTDENNMPIKFSLFDLVLFPNLEKNAEGYGRVFKSQFSPSYNRLRLAYISKIQDGGRQGYDKFYNKNCNVLDLTPIDHEIKRDEEGKSYVLSVSYRGYVQSVLTSPETDALSDIKIKEKRAQRDVLLEQALAKGCSLRELQKIQTNLNRFAANDVENVSGDMLNNLFKRATKPEIAGRGIFQLKVDQTIDARLRNGEKIDIKALKKQLTTPEKKLISNSQPQGTAIAQSVSQDFNEVNSNNNKSIYFFYLADLLDTILIQSSLFGNKAKLVDPTNQKIMKQQLRFLMGPFRDPEGNIINIGNIPIAVDFFKEWYQENVTQKELYVYPCLSFIRDMTERVITNLLNEVCFEALDDTKLLVRSSFFTGVKTSEGGDRIVNVLAPAYDKQFVKEFDIDDNSLQEIKDDLPMVQIGFRDNIKNYINYCVISTRQNRDQLRAGALTVEIPEFVLEGEFLGSQKVNFSRTTQTGLRESRYFRASNSGITMLASVYNATLVLDRPIHTFYPNQIIKIRIQNQFNTLINVGGELKSIFSELGLDGYYTITKVKTSIAPRTGIDTVTLEAIWISSDNPADEYRAVSAGSQSITDPTQATKNTLCNAYADFSKEIGFREQLGQSPAEVVNQIDEALDIPVATSQEGTEE